MFEIPLRDSKYTNQPPRFSTMPVNDPRNNTIAFKHGGRSHKTSHLREIANMLREKGQGEDKVLAHINKDEARELQAMHGSSINPHTGLPQFGKKKNIFKKILNIVSPITMGKKALPVIGSLGGFLLGGPAGAVAGGALGGGLSGRRDAQGHRNFVSNVLRGAGTGAMIGTGGHFVGGGSFGNLFGGGGMGRLPGVSGPGAPVVQGVPSWTSGLPSPAAQAIGPEGGGGFLGGIGEGLGGLLGGGKELLAGLGISPFDALLGGTAIAGLVKGKQKVPKGGQDNVPDFIKPRPDNFKPKGRFIDRDYVEAPEGYRPGIDPQHFYMQPMEEEQNEYAHGGYYEGGGYLDGGSGGQDDNIDAKLSPGEYVMDADVVSALGDGNNRAGAKKLDMMRVNIRKHKRKAKPNAIPPKAKKPEKYFSNYVRR